VSFRHFDVDMWYFEEILLDLKTRTERARTYTWAGKANIIVLWMGWPWYSWFQFGQTVTLFQGCMGGEKSSLVLTACTCVTIPGIFPRNYKVHIISPRGSHPDKLFKV